MCREIESARKDSEGSVCKEIESVCKDSEGSVCKEIESVCLERGRLCREKRERERERDGKCLQREGNSVF